MNIVEIYFKLSLTKFDSVQPWTWNGRENIFYGATNDSLKVMSKLKVWPYLRPHGRTLLMTLMKGVRPQFDWLSIQCIHVTWLKSTNQSKGIWSRDPSWPIRKQFELHRRHATSDFSDVFSNTLYSYPLTNLKQEIIFS